VCPCFDASIATWTAVRFLKKVHVQRDQLLPKQAAGYPLQLCNVLIFVPMVTPFVDFLSNHLSGCIRLACHLSKVTCDVIATH